MRLGIEHFGDPMALYGMERDNRDGLLMLLGYQVHMAKEAKRSVGAEDSSFIKGEGEAMVRSASFRID